MTISDKWITKRHIELIRIDKKKLRFRVFATNSTLIRFPFAVKSKNVCKYEFKDIINNGYAVTDFRPNTHFGLGNVIKVK